MADWLITYGSWALAPFGLAGMIVTGRKKTWGWLLALTTQLLWAVYALGTAQYGFLIGTTSYAVVYLDNYLRWQTGRGLTARLRRAPAGCPSVSPDGTRPCQYPLGHTTRHGDPTAGASGINWDDEEVRA